MTGFDRMWQALADKNPGLRDDKAAVKITSANFRKALEQAYNAGRRAAEGKPSLADILGGGFR